MHTLRKLKNLTLGRGPPSPDDAAISQLEDAGVPISTVDCRTCEDPCEDHGSYPPRFDVDMESPLLGSIKAFRRQIVISTGKTDWAHEVTEVNDTLAAHILAVRESSSSSSSDEKGPAKDKGDLPGVFHSSDALISGKNVAILNGSHRSMEHDTSLDTVLVFPDYKIVSGVPRTADAAQTLWDTALNPAVGRAGSDAPRGEGVSSWVLPYGCVILLCSHKRRDKRCAVAAPLLEQEFIRSLSSHGWEPHTELIKSTDDLDSEWSLDSVADSESDSEASGGDAASDKGDEKEGEQADAPKKLTGVDKRSQLMISKLKAVLEDDTTSKSALILKNSHVGGHKFVGNCIIYTPNGTGVWYGRVTPHDVEAVVSETIVGGRIIPQLLRGGLNITRDPKCAKRSLADW